MDLSLNNKTAVVCGSTQGIGNAAARELANLGATVILIARNKERLEQTLADLPETEGQKHRSIAADFSNAEVLKNALQENITENEVHVLVNNTGGPPGGPVFDAKLEEFENAFTQHLKCNHLLVQHLVPKMKTANFGRIINIISTSVKQPIAGLGVSNTIRAAVANWAKTLSFELAPFGITVNNVLPGATKTVRLESIIRIRSQKTGKSTAEVEKELLSKIPANRFAEAEEIAAAIAFLASPAAAYINGVNVPVDGGRTSSL
ncbi:MAG: SDR family oxidoreductase [bacterium]|nr:SDR family oxidoreductase [bacterium]